MLWHQEKGKNVEVPLYCLSIVNEYNFGMGDVDKSDQLFLQYRIQYWLRTQKWWFNIFLWIFECSLTNCYVLYRKFHDIHGRQMPRTHYEFIQDIYLAWLNISQYWPTKKSSTGSGQSSSESTTVAESVVTRRCKLYPKRSDKFTEKSLNQYSGSLWCRLYFRLNHLPLQNYKPEGSFQMHWWSKRDKYCKQLLKCPACNVILCLDCYKPFHEVLDLNITK